MWCHWEVGGRVPQRVRARVPEGDGRHNGAGLERHKVSGRVAEVWSLPPGERSSRSSSGDRFPQQVIEQHIEEFYVTRWIYTQIIPYDLCAEAGFQESMP